MTPGPGWQEEPHRYRFATGVERIDRQHKMLFKMAEDYRLALDEGQGERVYRAFLDSLDLYARSHFRFEEGCMEQCHCPAAQSNRDAHGRFVDVLAQFHQRYAAKGFDPADARGLTNTLDRWLADHIGRIDVQLKDGEHRS